LQEYLDFALPELDIVGSRLRGVGAGEVSMSLVMSTP